MNNTYVKRSGFILLLLTVLLLQQELATCQKSPPKGCKTALGVGYGGSIPSESITASSNLDSNFTAQNGRLDSPFAWMPAKSMITEKGHKEYLQIDFGVEKTITGIITQGFKDSYVQSFKLMISHDGKLYTYYQNRSGDKIFTADRSTLVAHFICPVVARYARIVPLTFKEKIALRVEFFGCDSSFKVNVPNITEIRQLSVQQKQLTFSWSISGSYDEQEVSYFGGQEILYKRITSQDSTVTETIKNLKPCTLYEITISASNNCKSTKKSFSARTPPELPLKPSDVVVSTPSAFTIFLQWKMPRATSVCSANITGFNIQYRPKGIQSGTTKTLQLSLVYNASLTQLDPWIEYQINIFSNSVHGRSGAVSREAYVIGKPPEKPVDITQLSSETDDSFTIKWKKPPVETINGDLRGYRVHYRKKSASVWHERIAQRWETNATISSLSSDTTYQVYVELYNNKYSISTDIKEVYIKKRTPVLSTDLTKTLILTSEVAGQCKVAWKVPSSIETKPTDVIVVNIRKLGEKHWIEKNNSISEPNSFTIFENLIEWRVYEAMIKVVTKKGIFYTEASRILINGQDNSRVVRILLLTSQKTGTVNITVKIPKQYIASKLLSHARIRWSNNGSASPMHKSINPRTGVSFYSIESLEKWTLYRFELGISLRISSSNNPVFTSKPSDVIVLGDLPGKAPALVNARGLGPYSIQVSWQPIPSRYINGYLTSYTIFLSNENTTVPFTNVVSNTTTSLIFNDLQADTSYYAQVAGKNLFGYGPLSNIATTRTAQEPRPPTPVLLKTEAVSWREILVTWTSVVDPKQKQQNFTVIASGPSGEKFSKVYLTKEDVKKGTEHNLRFQNLKPSTSYQISVFATKVVKGKILVSLISNVKNVTTKPVPLPAIPQLTSAYSVSPREIRVTWLSSLDLSLKLENFTVVAVDKDGRKVTSYFMGVKSSGDRRTEKTYELTIRKLKPFTVYTIHVYASKIVYGKLIKSKASNEKKVETMESAPSEPIGLTIDNTYHLTWNPPAEKNGILRKYILRLYSRKSRKYILIKDLPGIAERFRINLILDPYSTYDVHLQAFTVVEGKSAHINFTTPEGRPTAPQNVHTKLNNSEIIVKWGPPKDENGIILRYKVLYRMAEIEGRKSKDAILIADPLTRTFIMRNISSGYRYTIRVAAETSQGPGEYSRPAVISVEPETVPKPQAPPEPSVMKNKVRSTTMVIKLKPLKTKNAVVSFYQVIIEKLNSATIQRRNVQNLPSQIHNYGNATNRGEKFYIAAEFKASELPDEFVVGDGKMYSGFYNAPLLPGTVYKVHLRGVARDKHGNLVYGEAASVRSPTTALREMKKKPSGTVIPLPVVAGIAGALLILIILVAIIIVYLRSGSARRRSRHGKEASDMELAKLRTKIDPDEQRPVSLTGDFPLHPDHPPISKANYSKHIAKLHRSDNTGFRAEYNQLEMGKEFSWDVAHLPENKPKNRFANIVAYDHARVILTKIPGIPGSDYINASYIDGFMKPNSYIATQGPLPNTFNDFWRMVWEVRSSVIVMLTNLHEKNKLKCHKYWPDDCIEYGEVIVTLIRKEMYADYMIRTFLLERTDSQESREVKHFHFVVWPDHGVPRYATAILAFKRRVRAYCQPDCGPTVVHCSAGVGRTGTYITLDAMLDRINIQGDVDVFNFIAALRTRRIAMVQTEEQYIFIHDAILEALQCGNTEITAVDLRMAMNRLEKISLETRMTGFEKEWKVLNNVSPIPPKSSCNIATMHENINKNRSQSVCVLPADNNLVRLLTIEDDEATAYINAVYVDGYKQRNAFILTQSPLKNTTMDFWRMLCEHKSASVVLLCSLDEGDDFVKFWPEAHIREYEMITVELTSRTKGNGSSTGDSFRPSVRRGDNELVIRQFKVEDTRFPDHPMMVKLFQYIGWSETRVPENCDSVIQLINQLERWQQQSGNGPVTVVCSDGLGRSGTFAALNAVIDRVKVEQAIDVFQAIKAMRIQRAHLVKTLDQYQFIYRAVEGYLTAFDDYANFK